MPRHGQGFLPQKVGDAAFIQPHLAQRGGHGVAQAFEGEAGLDQTFGLQSRLEAVPDGGEAVVGPLFAA